MFLATKMGWFIVVLLPASGVIIYDIIKLMKLIFIKKSTDDIKDITNNIKKKSNTKHKFDQDEINETLEKIKKSDYINRLNELKNNNDK